MLSTDTVGPMDHRSMGSVATTTIDLRWVLGHIVFFLALLPWVNFGTNELDTQPWTLISCVVYLVTSPKILTNRTIQILVGSIFAGLIFVIVFRSIDDLFLTARGIAGYTTIALTAAVFYDFFERYDFPIKTLIFTNGLYIIFALVDRVNPSISSLLSASRTTEGRGVTSLAAEPSFLAVVLFFCTWIFLASQNYRFDWKARALCLANVIGIVVFAKSALGLVMMATGLGAVLIYQTLRLRVRYIVGLLAGVGALMVMLALFYDQIQGSRLFYIVQSIHSRSVADFLISDASANTRLQSIVFPILAAFENFLIPGGFESYGASMRELRSDYRLIFTVRGSGDIISSWVGALIYELGIFGVVALTVILFAETRRNAGLIMERAVLVAVCIQAIPTNFPPVAVLLVLLLRRARWADLSK